MFWPMFAVAMGFLGLLVLGVLAVRVFVEAERLGRQVTDSARRIGRAAEDLERAAAGQPVDHAVLVRACHSLVGIAATLGLTDAAEAARRHETALQAAPAEPRDLGPLLDLIRGTEDALFRAAGDFRPAAETAEP